MDDIYFSRKKNSGEDSEPVAPNESSRNQSNDIASIFNTDYDNGDKSRYSRTDSVFSSGYTPGSSSNDVFSASSVSDGFSDLSRIRKEISQRDRVPEELRDTYTDTDSDDDYFASKYFRDDGVTDILSDAQPMDEAEDKEPDEEEKPRKKRRKMKKGQKTLISVLLILLILLGSTGAYGVSILGKLNYNTTGLEPNEYVNESELMRDDNVKNILFIGCDDANGAQYSRSDTMMLVSIDKTNKAIKLTSFLRDSYLYIPGRNCKAKINSACTFGGPQFVVDALEYNFEVDIEHYVMVDFKMFINIVNALGGIDVEIEDDEAEFLNRNCSNFKGKAVEGYNHLNGLQALDYCRIRKLDSDFYRTQRQRKVISEIISKIKSFSVFNLLGQLDTILQYVETDIPKNDLISLGMGALTSYLKYDIMQERMPYGECGDSWYYDYTSGGESIIAVDVEANTQHIQEFIYKTAPETEATEESESE